MVALTEWKGDLGNRFPPRHHGCFRIGCFGLQRCAGFAKLRARMASENFVPAGLSPITPYLYVENSEKAAAFYTSVFGAKMLRKWTFADGKVFHLELEISGAKLFLCDSLPAWSNPAPNESAGSSGAILLYVPDADKTIERAIAAGSKLVKAAENSFWGDRYGAIVDPFGYRWGIATHLENISVEQIEERKNAWAATCCGVTGNC